MENVVIFEERTYLSADKRTQIHGYIWRPEGIPLRGIIQISHGMCEYIKRYDAWARRFCEIGFVVCGNDHLGHGETAENAEELGFIPQKIGADCLVEDLHAMSQLIKAEYPELPLVLYGHSMGSFVLRAYLSCYGEELSAALISGTAGAGQPTAVAKKLAQTIAAVKGDHHRSKLLTSLAFGAYNKRFEDEQDRRSWLTREKSVRDAYKNDSLCRFKFTAAGYEALFTLLSNVSSKKWPLTVPKKLPILLFAGDMDPVGDYGKGVQQIYDRLVDAGCERVAIKLYAGGRHEMHNELNSDEVFADLTAFLEGALQ
jgi:alpha-beta hydrolase superfamily lysophospholipase